METKAWEGHIPVHYLYTYGIAGEEFFRAVKERGTFVATRCDKCKVTYLPPRIYCPRCMKGLDRFFEVGTTGKVKSFTVCHYNIEDNKLPKPVTLAVVGINGTDGALIHRLDVTSADKVKIGMEVRAVFKDPSVRKGHIEDIHFVPE